MSDSIDTSILNDPEAQTASIEKLDLRESRSWFLLALVSIISTAGLTFAVAPYINERMSSIWPWANTNVVLMVGLSISILLLVGYLTSQQRKSRAARGKMQRIIEDSAKRARQNTARLHALLNVSRMMGSVANLQSMFDSITKTCLEIFECQQASLMLLNEQTNKLEVRSDTGHLNKEAVERASQAVGERIAGWVAEQEKPLILTRDTDVSQYPGLELTNLNISAAMVVPILLRGELVGVLNISSRQPDATYTKEDLQALQVFAENAGTCIRHTEHVEWMRKTIQRVREHEAEKDEQDRLDITQF